MMHTAKSAGRRLLVFDSAYTYKILRERNIAPIVTGRTLGGYFVHIWTVHPVASLLEPEDSPERYGRPQTHVLDDSNTMIEGRIGRFRWLAWFPILNFILAQIDLLIMVRRILRVERIPIVRAEDPLYNGLLAWLFKRPGRRALMVGVWGNPTTVRERTRAPLFPRLFRKIWVEEKIERFILPRADLAMAQNEDNRRFLLEQGVLPERTWIFRLGNLLHPAHFTPPAERADGRADLAELGVLGKQTLLSIARLEPLKLIDHIIRVVRLLKDRGTVAYALLAGDGSLHDEMKALADELDVSDQIVFCGNRDQHWLARIIPHISVVMSPLNGRALGEAALGGRPVVAYDIDWHSELVTTGETGELVEYFDVQAMAAATERLLSDPEYADRAGATLRERTLELLDPAAGDAAQIEAYEHVLAELNSATPAAR
jgi:glycosyltransferase involved in cell wall biosynthesis